MGQTERKHTEDKRISWLRRTTPPDMRGKRRQPTWPKVNQPVLSSSCGIYELLLHGALRTARVQFQNANSPIVQMCHHVWKVLDRLSLEAHPSTQTAKGSLKGWNLSFNLPNEDDNVCTWCWDSLTVFYPERYIFFSPSSATNSIPKIVKSFHWLSFSSKEECN